MSIVERLRVMVIAGKFDAIDLVMEMLGHVKIVDLSEEEVARLVEILKPKVGA